MLQGPGRGQLFEARQPLGEALAHDMFKVLVEREPRRHVEVGQMVDGVGQVDVAAFRNPERVG